MNENTTLGDLISSGLVCEHCGRELPKRKKKAPKGYPMACRKCVPGQDDDLPGIECAHFNNGHHWKFHGRFNYWPRRQKWHDSVTGVTGRGWQSFTAHVVASIKAHAEGQRIMAQTHNQQEKPM